ncbi:MAG: adenylosuccinate synthase [Armatimonadetes bacterium]|nr:adenylosuccinate synthase [Armatimonadota bacterium]
MAAIVVVGAQWGDEAKGKIVDLLAQRADIVVRYGGGSNAGHTVTVGNLVLKLHLVPSGILNPRTLCVISGGVVLDPAVLLREVDELRSYGISTDSVRISQRAHVVLPYHKELDRLEELRRGVGKIGTTMQGVGPAYEDKARRCGIRVMDLVDSDRLRARVTAVLPDKNFLIARLYGGTTLDRDAILEEYTAYGARIRPMVADTDALLHAASTGGQRIVFEGAQGTMLDLDHGTYPYVTSSHPVAGGACLGTGVGPKALQTILGVTKSYTTRVGEGAFPTELLDETGNRIREQGHEYGTTTGRPRRIGWLDTVALRYAARVNGLDCLAATLLDVLTGLPRLRICAAYEIDGERTADLPANGGDLARVQAVYEDLPGWEELISHARRLEDLPAAARDYLERVAELAGVPIALVSVGPQREQTIVLQPEILEGGSPSAARRHAA